MSSNNRVARRRFLAASALGSAWLSAGLGRSAEPVPLKVAAVYTVFYNRYHAHVILENFLRPYLFNGKRITPPVKVVSFYADQIASQGDMTEAVAKESKIPVFKTIAEALTLGGDKLAVDAVLSIGEHGRYPRNELGQIEYPRKRFFDEIVAVMRRSNRFVPIFNDKHLSYRFDWAREMVETSRKHGIPLMAGSSVPLAQRRPEFELPGDARIEEAVSVHGGGIDGYDFHALEVLQSMVEFRKGGETGIAQVEFLTGEALAQAVEKGRWSMPLAEAAVAQGKNVANLRKSLAGGGGFSRPHAILLTYNDGLKATLIKVGNNGDSWSFACKLAGDKHLHATSFYMGPWRRNPFMALAHAIQDHFAQRRAPYPVERTLLTSGIVESAMRSRFEKGRVQQTPHLQVAYQPRDFRALREMGASWKLLEGVREISGRLSPIGEP